MFYKTEICQTSIYVHFNLYDIYSFLISVCNIFALHCILLLKVCFCFKLFFESLNIQMIFNYNCLIQLFSKCIYSYMSTFFNYLSFLEIKVRDKLRKTKSNLEIPQHSWQFIKSQDLFNPLKFQSPIERYLILDWKIFNVNVVQEIDTISHSYLAGI